LIIDRCCGTNPEQCPNFNLDEIVYMFRDQSFLEALEVDIGAVKHYQATVVSTQLQAKRQVQLAERRKVVPVSVIGHVQRTAEMADTVGIIWLGKCYWRGIGIRRREGTPRGSGAGLHRAHLPLRPPR
jgi:acid stress-induced BolA-like protein IbaG/YrbA